MNVNHYLITVTKNSATQLKVDVAEHEIPILQEIHGYENVLNSEAKLLNEGLGEPTRTREINETEYDRLCHKYGFTLIEKCIGNKAMFIKSVRGVQEPKPEPKKRTKKADAEAQQETEVQPQE